MNIIMSGLVGLLMSTGGTAALVPVEGRSPGQLGHGAQDGPVHANQMETRMQQHPYAGMWVTADGHVRQELRPDGRYDEARGTRQSAYQGRYEIRGNHIDYWDDTGFTADGTFVNPDELHHGGMIFFRQK